jgi:hypothetical protein
MAASNYDRFGTLKMFTFLYTWITKDNHWTGGRTDVGY